MGRKIDLTRAEAEFEQIVEKVAQSFRDLINELKEDIESGKIEDALDKLANFTDRDKENLSEF